MARIDVARKCPLSRCQTGVKHIDSDEVSFRIPHEAVVVSFGISVIASAPAIRDHSVDLSSLSRRRACPWCLECREPAFLLTQKSVIDAAWISVVSEHHLSDVGTIGPCALACSCPCAGYIEGDDLLRG